MVARWALLLGLGLLLSLSGAGVATVPALLAAGGLWNLLLSARGLRGRMWPRQAALEVAGDAVLAAALFYFSRTLLGPLAWAGLLPVASAALGFGLGGGLAAALGTTALFAALALIDVPMAEIPFSLALPAFLFLLAGSLLGILGRQWQAGARLRSDLAATEIAEREQRERARTRAVYQAGRALNSSLVFDQVLESALDLGCNALAEPHEGVTRAAGGVLLFGEGGLRLAAARRLPASDLGRVLPGQQGALGALLQDGEARRAQPRQDEEFQLLAGLQNAQSLYALPLRAGVDLFGVMFFAHPEAEFFNEQRGELIEVIANQVVVALQNAQLYETLTEEKERITHIQEQTLAQLARSLHDGPSQNMAAMAMRVNLARRLLAKDPAAAGEELHRIEELSRQTAKEMRHLLFTLQPQTLADGGLAAALDDLAAHTGEIYEVKAQVQVEAEAAARLGRSQQTALFDIAVEALANAQQHARAAHILVRLALEAADVVLLEVRDDGTGFTADLEQHRREREGALGLSILRERAELLHARLRLDSEAGSGTRLRVWVPLNERAAERLRQGEP
jgi:signal transduction histidine kinase